MLFRSRMYHHARRLVEDDEICVVEEDLEWNVFRLRGAGFRLRQVDANDIALPDVIVGLDLRVARMRDAAVFNEPLDLRSRVIGNLRRQEPVQAFADVLRLGGFLASPAEIESELQGDPSIDGAQVVSIADAAGTKPIAFVTLKPGGSFDEAALIARCKASLAGFKVPARVFCLDAFPSTVGPNGTKVQRHRLRDMADEFMRLRRTMP